MNQLGVLGFFMERQRAPESDAPPRGESDREGAAPFRDAMKTSEEANTDDRPKPAEVERGARVRGSREEPPALSNTARKAINYNGEIAAPQKPVALSLAPAAPQGEGALTPETEFDAEAASKDVAAPGLTALPGEDPAAEVIPADAPPTAGDAASLAQQSALLLAAAAPVASVAASAPQAGAEIAAVQNALDPDGAIAAPVLAAPAADKLTPAIEQAPSVGADPRADIFTANPRLDFKDGAPPPMVRLDRVDAPMAQAADAARQVMVAIASGAAGEGDAIDIRLDPPELGRVRIQMSFERSDYVTATVSSERGETLDFLRRHADDLARELERAGFARVRLDFSDAGQNRNGEARQGAAASYSQDASAEDRQIIYLSARETNRLDRLV